MTTPTPPTSQKRNLRFQGKYLLFIPLLIMSVFYLLPLYVMLTTGFKSFDEVNLQTMWNFPKAFSLDNYIAAYEKLAPHLKNSLIMVIPAALISSMVGSLNGFVLARWRFRGSNLVFPLLLFGMFIPYQSILIPLAVFMKNIGEVIPFLGAGTIPGLILVHVIYGIPITRHSMATT